MSGDTRHADTPHRLLRELCSLDSRPSTEDDLSASISSSIVMIEQAAQLLEGMQETIRMHEETIYDLNREIANLNSQKEDAFGKLLQLEEICRREADKAAKAEAQRLAFESRFKAADQRSVNLTAQLDRMIQAVSKSFADRADTEVFRHPLRAVP